MNRQLLRALMGLGVILTLVTGTGIFAVFTDRATTGLNDFSTAELGQAADLLVAAAPVPDPMVVPPFDCGTFSDDLATGLISATSAHATSGVDAAVCLRNAGTAPLDLTMSVIDLVDTDPDCTGDEAAFGDATCGSGQTGELSPFLKVELSYAECSGGGWTNNDDGNTYLDTLTSTPRSLTALSLNPGQDVCVVIRVMYVATGNDTQITQSDEATWRFAFDGTVPSA